MKTLIALVWSLLRQVVRERETQHDILDRLDTMQRGQDRLTFSTEELQRSSAESREHFDREVERLRADIGALHLGRRTA
jgi:hypothetical protein